MLGQQKFWAFVQFLFRKSPVAGTRELFWMEAGEGNWRKPSEKLLPSLLACLLSAIVSKLHACYCMKKHKEELCNTSSENDRLTRDGQWKTRKRNRPFKTFRKRESFFIVLISNRRELGKRKIVLRSKLR